MKEQTKLFILKTKGMFANKNKPLGIWYNVVKIKSKVII